MNCFRCDCWLHRKDLKYSFYNKKKSKFYEDGKLTPEEFIDAGDYLIMKCPIWKWCSSKESLNNKSLPNDKQYLKTTIPSHIRAFEYLENNRTIERIVIDDWNEIDLKKNESKSFNIDNGNDFKNVKDETDSNDDDDFIIEDDDFIITGDENKDDNNKITYNKNNEDKLRIYDIIVTYDFYYCVPRIWLMGFNSRGIPLTVEEMREDIMPEYTLKTYTIEKNHFTDLINVSIHPCRTSFLFKKIMQDFQLQGKKLEPYLSILLSLKFFQSIIPTLLNEFLL